MDLLKGNIKQAYGKYLLASFGSALVTSIYGVVDLAMVGQYHGPQGAAAMAVIAPIWNIIYSFGLLTGIGGSVLFSATRGKGREDGEENQYFSSAFLATVLISALLWIGLWLFEEPLLLLFGADESLLDLAKRYVLPIKFTVPVFLFTQLLAAFLRNDSNPGLATKAVLIGGIFNVFGDYLLVFTCDLGIMGAGIATAAGATISVLVMLTHFFSPRNTLRLSTPQHFLLRLKRISVSGFSSFFLDLAMGFLTMLFNRQIMRYSGADALAVYGTIVNISTFVQCCAYGVGQAAQPILSINFGANQLLRIRQLVRYNLLTVAVISGLWLTLCVLVPQVFIYLFMSPTPGVLQIAPLIIRCYSLSFLFLPLNIYSTYLFQSILRPGLSFVVSVSRGLLLSGLLICLLPIYFGELSLWLAMPITETLVAIFVLYSMRRLLHF